MIGIVCRGGFCLFTFALYVILFTQIKRFNHSIRLSLAAVLCSFRFECFSGAKAKAPDTDEEALDQENKAFLFK